MGKLIFSLFVEREKRKKYDSRMDYVAPSSSSSSKVFGATQGLWVELDTVLLLPGGAPLLAAVIHVNLVSRDTRICRDGLHPRSPAMFRISTL
jgi:hypothetical protein